MLSDHGDSGLFLRIGREVVCLQPSAIWRESFDVSMYYRYPDHDGQPDVFAFQI